jgi:hypothetical protein
MYVSNTTKVSSISESINIATYSSIITLDYNLGGIFYISNHISSFTCNFINIPLDSNRRFILTLIINTNNSSSYRYYCNACQVNGITNNLLFTGGSSSISVTSAYVITQTFSFINIALSTPLFIISNITSNQ